MKKDKKICIRISNDELKLLEDIANSFTENGKNVSISKAIILSAKCAKGYAIKNKFWRPIKTIQEINEENEKRTAISKRLGINESDLYDLANLDWLGA